MSPAPLKSFYEAGVPLIICTIRQGTPPPYLAYLANFYTFFHCFL